MNLADLVKYLRSEACLQKLYQEKNLDDESEAIFAYAKGELSIQSEVCFFPIEDVDDDLVFEIEGTKYYHLFEIGHGVEIYSYFEDEFEKGNYSELGKAKRLLQYLVNDA
ncbi:hypothetical protein [Rufibacter tibetensis]|nr:hypothetical protein [Rufibacter tibetensis]